MLLPKKTGDCESCDAKNTSISIHHGNMWYCDKCWERELQAEIEHHSVESVNSRLNELNQRNIEKDKMNQALRESQRIDSSIQVKTDLFNAATVSIIELKKSIDSDETITNKPFALAEQLMSRFTHFKSTIFELNQKIVEAGNQQKAIQVYLNQLSNTLRVEEREKLKITDISYKPAQTKISSPKPIKVSTKLNKVELRKYAAELGVSEFTLQMIVVQKGISVVEAAKLIQASINSAISNPSNPSDNSKEMK